MVLKAVFLELSGVIIRDGNLQQPLMDELLIAENLRPNPLEFAEVCRGRSDRACLNQLLNRRGRVVSEAYLDKLLTKKSTAYIQALAALQKLPLYPGLEDFLYQLKTDAIPLGVVAGISASEVDWVLAEANLTDQFVVRITGEQIAVDASKPEGAIYTTAIAAMNEKFPEQKITAQECLAVEASFNGIAAAKAAGVPVVGVAHLYPYRMMQRQATWAVDYLNEIDLDWIRQAYGDNPDGAPVAS
ncbi:MAG: HAD family phosphatase [Cyanobacteria bacterium P01_H01_bin.58]